MQPLAQQASAYQPRMLAAVGGTATSAAAVKQGLVTYDEQKSLDLLFQR